MQMLSQLEVQGEAALEDMPAFLAESGVSGETYEYAARLVRITWDQRESLDRTLTEVSPQWPPQRMSSVERVILRAAVVEMQGGEVPVKAAIDEAIEIGREFGGADTPRFINGVLDAVYRKMLKETGASGL